MPADGAAPARPLRTAPGLTELLLAALAAAPFVVDYSGSLNDHADLPQRVFFSVAAAAAAAWAAWRAAADPEPAPLTLTRWHAAAAAFLAWCGLTGLWSRAGLEWWLEWRHWLMAGAAGAAAAAAGGRARSWPLAALFASCCATALLGLLQYLEVRPFSLMLQAVPPSCTFGHRSFAMHWLVLGAPVGVLLWARASGRLALWALSAGLGLTAGLALLASARAAWLAGAFELALLVPWLAWEARRGALPGPARERWASAAAALALALAMAFGARAEYQARYGSFSTRLTTMVTGLTGSPKGAEVETAAIPANNVRMRLAIWRNATGILLRRPLRGAGLGNFQVHYPWFNRWAVPDGVDRENLLIDHAHNDPLELLVETGAVGLLLWLAAGAAALAAALRLLRSDDPDERAVAAGLAASLGGILVNSLFCLPAHRALPPAAAAVFMGVLAGRAGGRPWRPPEALRRHGAAALAAGAVVLALFGARALLADAFFGRANGSITVLQTHPEAPAGMPAEEWARRRAAVLLAIIDDARTAQALSPSHHHLYTLGAALAVGGRWDEALAVLVPFTERRPNHFRALINLAAVLTAKGRLPEAEQVAGRARNIRPESAKANNAVGMVLLKEGRGAEAAAAFARAAAAAPDEPAYPYRRGEALVQAGDLAGARAAYEAALALSPGNAEALTALSKLPSPARRPGSAPRR